MFGYQIWSEHGRRERVLMGGKNLFMLTQVSGLRSGLGFKVQKNGHVSRSRTEVAVQRTNTINFLDPFKS